MGLAAVVCLAWLGADGTARQLAKRGQGGALSHNVLDSVSSKQRDYNQTLTRKGVYEAGQVYR